VTFTFILQSTAFFLVGLEMPQVIDQMPPSQVRTLLVAVPVVFLSLVAARFVFVYLMAMVTGRDPRNPGWLVAAWAGTRGPVSALAAFTVPATTEAGDTIPFRELIISITFGVVLLSLLLAPTIAWLARAVDLPQEDDTAMKRRVRVSLARAALDRLEQIEETSERTEDPLHPDMVDRLRSAAEARLDHASRVAELGDAPRPATHTTMRQIGVEMLRAEHEELLRLRDREGLPDEIVREMQREIDLRIRTIG
jgi:CPA1 family monovalent cation:H+ antiporter